MDLPTNPQLLANYDITNPVQAKTFVKAVSDLLQVVPQLVTLITPSGLSGILNGTNSLFSSALLIQSVSLGTVTTNQTLDCAGAAFVSISVAIATTFAFTLTLTHLGLGVPVTVMFTNLGGSGVSLQIAATQPGGTAYGAVVWKTSTTLINMTSTGIAVGPGVSVIGSGSSTPFGPWQLNMVAN